MTFEEKEEIKRIAIQILDVLTKDRETRKGTGLTHLKGEFWEITFALLISPLMAEPRLTTTATRLTSFIPWPVWYIGIIIASFIIIPLLTMKRLRQKGIHGWGWFAGAVGLGFLSIALGFILLEIIFFVSFCYANISPVFFVGSWFLLVYLMIVLYTRVAKHFTAKKG